MPNFYIRLAFIPILLFTSVLLLIHAQPYDDHELRELLLPEGCPAPCFMGIRPEVTTIEEARKTLETSGWVKQIMQDDNIMSWSWNESQTNILNSESKSTIYGNAIVYQITIPTHLTMGSIVLTEKNPISFTTIAGMDQPKTYLLILRYAHMLITEDILCDATFGETIHSRVTIIFISDQNKNYDGLFWDNGPFTNAIRNGFTC